MHDAAEQQVLSGGDRLMLALTRATQGMGWGGFGHLLQIEFEGHVDRERVQRLCDRLQTVHPVVTARLKERGKEAVWVFGESPQPLLEVISIASAEQIPQIAGELLRRPFDFARDNPLSVHLLQSQAGHDVLLVRFDHALTGASSFGMLVDELNRLDLADAAEPPAWLANVDQLRPKPSPPLSWAERRVLVRHGWSQRRLNRGTTDVRLASDVPRRRPPAVKDTPAVIIERQLSPEATATWKNSVGRQLGLPSASLSLLASVFRSLWKHRATESYKRRPLLVTSLAFDRRARGGGGPIFENHVTAVRITATPEELTNRQQLVDGMLRSVREQIKIGVDRSGMTFQDRLPGGWLLKLLARRRAHQMRSFWYGYFGELTTVDSLCGVRIRRLVPAIEPWPNKEVGLLGYEYRGELHVSCAYLPSLVEDARVVDFVNDILSDLPTGQPVAQSPGDPEWPLVSA